MNIQVSYPTRAATHTHKHRDREKEGNMAIRRLKIPKFYFDAFNCKYLFPAVETDVDFIYEVFLDCRHLFIETGP